MCDKDRKKLHKTTVILVRPGMVKNLELLNQWEKLSVLRRKKRGYNLSLVAGLAPLFLVFGQTRVCLVLWLHSLTPSLFSLSVPHSLPPMAQRQLSPFPYPSTSSFVFHFTLPLPLLSWLQLQQPPLSLSLLLLLLSKQTTMNNTNDNNSYNNTL